MEKRAALTLLRTSLNDPKAEFREDQWEAIDLLVNQHRKLMVVQRTGWGKSAVYFISTRILRDQGYGLSIIISPLLALMRNQIVSAQRLGINAVTINSTNKEEWESVKREILDDKVDALLISPERLANEDFMEELLMPIAERVGLLVVDEAHCISDWGHDFRTDYRRIVNILRFMPNGIPILATTATANNRVIEDIIAQLGDIDILRGTLVRESLALQNIILGDQAARLAWLKENVPLLPGSGIIYTLTIRDADQVARFLKNNGINAEAYHSGIDGQDGSEGRRVQLEDALHNNRIKALVATSALGMGYDKPDLGFVVHYQAPGSLIAYYQQVGRAGRAIDSAFGILLSGKEDKEILEYFIDSAFPSENWVNQILEALGRSDDGLTSIEMESILNLTRGQIEKVLKYLSVENPSPIIKSGSKWIRIPVAYLLDKEKIARLSAQKRSELAEVQKYISNGSCLMQYLRASLDDPENGRCGKCAWCLGKPLFSLEPTIKNISEAQAFLKHLEFDIEPRKKIPRNALPTYGWSGNIKEIYRAAQGKILSKWEDAGWGRLVAEGKHKGRFSAELVNAVAEMLKKWAPDPYPTWITCVPSLRHPDLVPKFAQELSERLELPFYPVVAKIIETGAQKTQQNSYFQCRNLDGAFSIRGNVPSDSVFLVDDAIDSGWTLTIVAYLLRLSGSGRVFPVALASTGHS
ncbi:MAG TPA: RecQ family ATP-dependent DNA helicase [Dinghuibacter sp.]|jgi:ATP-dependent DNA helicase RecQ|uniref:RecQ family ATP-dependent DNA helicase n=1 Tax=Dinghuibacter sp. TaxID=2024697 RepID=UPI002BC10EB4|nr:RecQ family ATP-dependent DNA helicase [Dinghuibacter sp.]HTJ14692.1 RecQ family ATP-dependent DNA helicase [Dinghuibacter sp.]